MAPVTASVTDQDAIVGVLGDLDLSIEETVFASPGEDTEVQPIEAWSTFGTTCWSCNSCSCSDSCGVSCNC